MVWALSAQDPASTPALPLTHVPCYGPALPLILRDGGDGLRGEHCTPHKS